MHMHVCQVFLHAYKRTHTDKYKHTWQFSVQSEYFDPPRVVFSFVLLLSVIVSFLQSLSQLIVKPE